MIAAWASRGGKWSAELYRLDTGYRLSELKRGASGAEREIGASFRATECFDDDAAAIAYYDGYVARGFDVRMFRTA